MISQVEFSLSPKGRGFHLVTNEIVGKLGQLPKMGLLRLFIQHTSAALSINENADPDVRYIKENQPVARVSLATTETFQKNGEKTSSTEWHRLVMWGQLAKNVEMYVRKGSQLYIEGKLHYSQ